MTQGQVHTIQTAQKTVEVPQVQFHDQVVAVLVVMVRQVPQERIQERIVEETDVAVPHVMGKITDVVKHISQERVLDHTVEQLVAVPAPRT